MEHQPLLREAFELLDNGFFSEGDSALFRPLTDNLRGHDPYCLLADFADYGRAQDEVALAWRDQARWQRMSILNTARSGHFSSDRAIGAYAEQIWKVGPRPLVMACDLDHNGGQP
jgi:starch phosphorylase